MLGSSWTISSASFGLSPLSVWPWEPAVGNAAKTCWFCPDGLQWGVGLLAAGRGVIYQKLPQNRAGTAQASGRVWTRHLCTGTGTSGISCWLHPTTGDPPACRPEPTAIDIVQLFPMQSNQKVVATLKSLKLNRLEGKLGLGCISGYHNQSQMLGYDKILHCENKVTTHLGYL